MVLKIKIDSICFDNNSSVYNIGQYLYYELGNFQIYLLSQSRLMGFIILYIRFTCLLSDLLPNSDIIIWFSYCNFTRISFIPFLLYLNIHLFAHSFLPVLASSTESPSLSSFLLHSHIPYSIHTILNLPLHITFFIVNPLVNLHDLLR